jgi:subtilisin family serine protease
VAHGGAQRAQDGPQWAHGVARTGRPALALAFSLALALALATLAAGAAAQGAPRRGYVVQLVDAPIASYEGALPGLVATRPVPGARLNTAASDVQAYRRYLDGRQAAVAAAVPAAPLYYRYGAVFNGFAAKLSATELQKLAAHPGVRAITADEPRRLATHFTPGFLGLAGPSGVWSRTDAAGRALRGEGVVIGHVDGGVWPENPSFSDKVDAHGRPVPAHEPGTVVYDLLPPGRYRGICQAGEGFSAANCNRKLIGARWFSAGWDASGNVLHDTEYRSPRDAAGHGTHTLATSGGNARVAVPDIGVSGLSGMAPRARLAAYKACYSPRTPGGQRGPGACLPSDSIAAIEQAVADGVDILNFSVVGSQTDVRDGVEVALLNAAAAGVFVAAAAGNGGPGNTVEHLGPWLTTVANSTHDRYTVARVVLGNGLAFDGASFQTDGLAARPLIAASAAGRPGADATALAQCRGSADGTAPMLDPAKVRGKLLVCSRGGNALVDKGANAQAAGAAGMVLLNLPGSDDSLPSQLQPVPTVHLPAAAAAAVLAHAAQPGGTAAFSSGVHVPGLVAPVLAGSSSRGPNKADADVLKPDLAAPGTDILAAYTDTTLDRAGRDAIAAGSARGQPGVAVLSGTSMAAPHVAGVAALLKQAHPDWSPAAIKSALMTSATPLKRADGSADADVWGHGAGQLNPTGALDTRLVYDTTAADFMAYAQGRLPGAELNLASVTRAGVVGIGRSIRTLTNTGRATVTYTASASLPGYAVAVSPATLTLAPGARGRYTVTVTRADAPVDAWRFGQLVWQGDGRSVRSPLQVKARAFAGVARVTDTRPVGSKVFTVTTGFAGPLHVNGLGLVPATRGTGTAVLGGDPVCFPVAVTAGAQLLRLQLQNRETEGGSASDLDITLYRDGAAVAGSYSAGSDETLDLERPAPGAYSACVEPYAPAGGSARFTLSHWVVGTAGTASLKAFGPALAYIGGTATIGLSWNVPAGPRYLGLVQYRQGAGGALLGQTEVIVDTMPALAAADVPSAPVLRLKPLR